MRTVTVPHEARGAAIARRRLSMDLNSHAVAGELAHDAALLLSELLGNAIRHAKPLAGGVVHVSWTVEAHQVQLRVTDGGADTMPSPSPLDADSIGGRGLAIVSALAASWGVEYTGNDQSVWAILRQESVDQVG